ncbi:Uncharacterised protein [Vibrio cholerae]|nr:Uncharacterised protein [Vibrio cholerae]
MIALPADQWTNSHKKCKRNHQPGKQHVKERRTDRDGTKTQLFVH